MRTKQWRGFPQPLWSQHFESPMKGSTAEICDSQPWKGCCGLVSSKLFLQCGWQETGSFSRRPGAGYDKGAGRTREEWQCKCASMHVITLTHVESHQFTLTSEAFQHQTMKQLWQTVLCSGRTMLHSDLGWSWRWNRQAWKTQSGWWHPRFRTAFPTWCWRGAFEQGNMEKIRESNEKSCLLRIRCLSNFGMQIQHLPKDKKWGKMSCRTCPTCPGTNVSLLCSAEPQQELCDSELYQTGGTGASHELARFR